MFVGVVLGMSVSLVIESCMKVLTLKVVVVVVGWHRLEYVAVLKVDSAQVQWQGAFNRSGFTVSDRIRNIIELFLWLMS